ncbi:MAG: hypothetical protein SGJ02_14325, partial [bacterium]|nr:hypothetical protein [bacterium]
MRSLIRLFFLFGLTHTISAQSIDSFELARISVFQYEGLLNKLFQLKSTGKTEIIAKAQDILCVGTGQLNPFPSLYEDINDKGCTLGNFDETWRFRPDCSVKGYTEAIGEYLIREFMSSKTTIRPEFRNICPIKTKSGVVMIRYESKGELVKGKCNTEWVLRIAVVNIKAGDAAITGIRFPFDDENSLPCLEPPSTGNELTSIEKSALEEQTKSLRKAAELLKQQLIDLDKELTSNRLALQKSKKENTELITELRVKSDSVSLYSQKLQLEHHKYLSSLADYSSLETEYLYYQNQVTKELDGIRKRLKSMDVDIRNFGNKVQNTIETYELFDIASTSFLAFNYGLVQAPYNPQAQAGQITDPIKYSFHTDDISRNFGIAYFRPTIGFFLSNLRLNFNKAPEPIYTSFDFDVAKESLFVSGIPFENLTYKESRHNLKTVNFGLTFYLLEVLNVERYNKRIKTDTNGNYVNENRT